MRTIAQETSSQLVLRNCFKQWWWGRWGIYIILVKGESESHSVMSDSLQPHGLYSPWNSPGQNTGVGSHSLLQGIFPTQGSNSGLPYCRRILYQLSHQRSPLVKGDTCKQAYILTVRKRRCRDIFTV